MTAANISAGRKDVALKQQEPASGHLIDNSKDFGFEKSIETVPQPDTWKVIAAGTVVPLTLASAAAFTSYITKHERVAIAAWIAAAVVGSASVIAAATVSHRRTVTVDRSEQGEKVHSGSRTAPTPNDD